MKRQLWRLIINQAYFDIDTLVNINIDKFFDQPQKLIEAKCNVERKRQRVHHVDGYTIATAATLAFLQVVPDTFYDKVFHEN